MNPPDDFPKRPDDFPWPTPMHPLEVARLLYETKPDNQNSRSPETQPPRFRGACTYLSRKEAAEYLHLTTNFLAYHRKYIPYYKIGERVLYIKEELDEIIRNNRQGGES